MFTEVLSKLIASARAPSATALGVPGDVISKLERLGILKEKGVLTEEEFLAQKAKILAE